MHDYLSLPDFLTHCVQPFDHCAWTYRKERGFAVWRKGTGGNVELLHIRTFASGKGHGRRLVYALLDRLKDDPPYHSVYGFTRTGNAEAQAFYGALGFRLAPAAEGLYREGGATLFWAPYTELVTAMTTHLAGEQS